MADHMTFPKTAEDFIKQYSFKDEKQEYTNGAELMPVFRVKQMMEHYFPEEVVMHGRWVKTGWNDYSCSACECQLIGHGASRWNHCPNCGARMDGGNDDDL